jgi:spore germination cell wall hydrolase CwlJ-like protein
MSNAPRLIGTAPSSAELEMVRILEDQRCLAEAMYYEARGEGRSGQEAIAEVVFHRMRTPGYPRSICGVVYQGANHGGGCQFSFACDGALQRPKSIAAWSQARVLAAKIMTGIVRLEDITGDAISFHAADIQPDWADHLERTIQIGNHVFYRSLSRTKSS